MNQDGSITIFPVEGNSHHAPNNSGEPGSVEFDASVRQLVDLSIDHSVTGAVVRANARAMSGLTNLCREAINTHSTMDLAGETAGHTMLFVPAFVAEKPEAFHLPSKVVALFLKLADDRRRHIEEIAKLHPDWDTALEMHEDAVVAEAIAEMEAFHRRRAERTARAQTATAP